MQNVHLSYPNRTDSATLSGGSWNSSLPLANLQNRRLSRVARSSEAALASTKFDCDLGSSKNVGAVALVAHNLSAQAKARVRGGNLADFSDNLYDSGWINVWPQGAIPQNLLEWEDDNFWLATLSQQAIAGYRAPFAHYPGSAQVLRYWRVELDDTLNSDGYLQIGRLFIGPNWTPTNNYSYGAGLGFDDATAVETSLTGEEFFDVRARYRAHKFDLDWLSADEAYGNVLDMQQQLGTSGEVLVSGDPDDIGNQPRRCFLGRLQSLSPVAQPYYQFYRTSFQIKELL